MSSTFWQCFGMEHKDSIKEMQDIYAKEDSDSAFVSDSSSFSEKHSVAERNSVNSLPCFSNKEYFPERLTHSFEAIPCSSENATTTYKNPIFVPVPRIVRRKLRIIMAGDHRVGKSCLVLRFLYNIFITRYGRTTENVKNVLRKYHDDWYYLRFIDLGGDRIKEKQPEDLIEQADGIIFVYSTDRANSIEELEDTVRIMKYDTLNHVIPSIVLGNKIDISRQVPSSCGQSFARRLNAAFAEVSAKTGEGTKEAFAEFIDKLMQLQAEDEKNDRIRDRAALVKSDQVVLLYGRTRFFQ